MTIGTLASIWRYPVKSQRYEALDEALVEPTGVHGDRISAYLIQTAGHPREGKAFRGKENDHLHLTASDAEAKVLADRARVHIERAGGGRYFDDAPVSLIVDRWLDELSAHVGYAVAPLRFRPNFFVTAAPEFAAPEATLEGRELRLGAVTLRVRYPIERCVVTTYDPNGGPSDPRILRFVAQQRNSWMGVYCDVVEPGRVRVSDLVTSR